MDRAGAQQRCPVRGYFQQGAARAPYQHPGLSPSSSRTSSAWRPKCVSTPRVSSLRGVGGGRRAAPNCWPGCGGAPNGSQPLAEIRSPGEWVARAGWRVGVSGPAASWPDVVGAISCPVVTFHARPVSALHCAVSGGPGLVGACWCWPLAAGCAVTAFHVDHGLRPESSCRGRGG